MRFPAATTTIFALLLDIGILFAQEAPEKPIVAAAQSWLGEIDSGNYAKSWQQASAYFKGG